MTGHNPYHMTQKQRWIMNEIMAGNVNPISGERESDLDLDELIERLAIKYPKYAPTKQAIQFSIRFLERKNLIDRSDSEKRRGRRRRLLKPTSTGVQIYFEMSRAKSSYDPGVVVEGFDDDFDELVPEFIS